MARYGASGAGFNGYAAGNKRYGLAGRSAPNVGAADKAGYKERNNKIAAKKNAVLRRLQAEQSGKYRAPAAQRPIKRG